MRTRRLTWNAVRLACAAALGASLASCGGGGDGGGGGPQYIDVTATNRDTVAHATAASLLALPTALGTTSAVPLSAGSGQAAATSTRPFSLLLQSRRSQSMSTGSGREQPLAVIGPIVAPCAAGGTVSATIDDRDGNGVESVGDVETLVYSNCMITASETMNGSAVLTVTQTSPDSVSYRMALTQYSDVTTNHSLTLNGSVLLELVGMTSSVQRTRVTADGPVVVSVTTHLPFSDTVTLRSGFVEEESYDASVAPPPGMTVYGQTTSTANGSIQSTSAGGIVDVSISASRPMMKYSAEGYAHSGVVKVKGKTGTLLMSAVSASSVRLDLDDNDDGAIESTHTDVWDWLL